MILGKVIYSGIHSGDFISTADLARLEIEARDLAGLQGEDENSEWRLRRFEAQINRLIAAAISVGKPLCF